MKYLILFATLKDFQHPPKHTFKDEGNFEQ